MLLYLEIIFTATLHYVQIEDIGKDAVSGLLCVVLNEIELPKINSHFLLFILLIELLILMCVCFGCASFSYSVAK